MVERLLARGPDSVRRLDVSAGPLAILRLFFLYWRVGEIVLALGKRGCWAALAIIGLCRVMPGRRPGISFMVVGGWLGDMIASAPLYRMLAGCVDHYFVEAAALARQLRDIGLRATVFPNFRVCQPGRPKGLRGPGSLALCFCSRVRKDKGVLEAVELVVELKRRGIPATLDIHGPVGRDFETELQARLSSADGVRYCGPYDDDTAIALMGKYDLLVFPTRYPGECLPGVVVEAYAAGTPVVSSDWRFMPEFVADGKSGFVIPLERFVSGAADRLEEVANGAIVYHDLSAGALEIFLARYSLEQAMESLRSALTAPPTV